MQARCMGALCIQHLATQRVRLPRPGYCHALRTVPVCQAGAGISTNSGIELRQTRQELKQQLLAMVEPLDRGIFGAPAEKRREVADLVNQLERLTPLRDPTQHLSQLGGRWRLLYTTISIAGAKKTKLGLREFVALGEFEQIIDTAAQHTVNKVDFKVLGLGSLSGSLTIEASYQPSSLDRVDIKFLRADLVPEALARLFKENYSLLLSIFNPEGWLDITYVDAQHRIGRDDKDHIFFLERC